jgi:hypothetical protein
MRAWFACVVVLRFYFFSLPHFHEVFSFNFFHAKSVLEKRGFPLFSFLCVCIFLVFGRICAVLCVCVYVCERAAADVVCVLPCIASASFSGACKACVAVATHEDVGFIPVHERLLGRRLDEDIDFATRLLEELLDFGHGAVAAELIAVDGEVDPFVIDTRDVSREERDSAAELRVGDGDEVRLTRHEAALDEDFASLQLLRLGGESADGEPGEESGERARDCVLHRGHALLAWIAWWYFDSTSFPYQLPWRFSLSIFFNAGGEQEMRVHNKKNRFFLFFLFYVCIFLVFGR